MSPGTSLSAIPGAKGGDSLKKPASNYLRDGGGPEVCDRGEARIGISKAIEAGRWLLDLGKKNEKAKTVFYKEGEGRWPTCAEHS